MSRGRKSGDKSVQGDDQPQRAGRGARPARAASARKARPDGDVIREDAPERDAPPPEQPAPVLPKMATPKTATPKPATPKPDLSVMPETAAPEPVSGSLPQPLSQSPPLPLAESHAVPVPADDAAARPAFLEGAGEQPSPVMPSPSPMPEDEPVVTVTALNRFRRALWVWWALVAILLLACAWGGLLHVGLALALVVITAAPGLVPAPRPARKASPAPSPRSRRDRRIEALVAALPEPALLLTAGGEIVTANARVALSIGQARAGDPLSFVVRVPEVLEAVRAAATDGLTRRVEFAERVPLDRWLEAHVVPLHLDGRARKGASAASSPPDGVLLTFRDLTHQRRVEQMRADFVANASHELRTPLASLSGFIETLQGPARNDEKARERFLGIMSAQARRMSRLIDDLLSLSRIELHAHVQPETEVDLCDILNHVCDALSPLAQERGMQIEQICEARSLPVRGDRDELIRLLENLVENALKYGSGGERVTVRMSREEAPNGAFALVSVRDYGPGIPPEHLPRLTERFYRVNVAASRGQGGTGLGLAIVKHIVARHRGRLNIESVPNEGATFSFRLDILPDK